MATETTEEAPPEEAPRIWFVGFYATRELKASIKAEAKREKRTVSQQLIKILEDRYDSQKNK